MYLILIFSTGFFIPIPFAWTLLFPLSSLSWRDYLCPRSATELPLWGSPLLWLLDLLFSLCPRFSVVWLRNSVQWLEMLTKHSRCPVFLANGTSPLTEASPFCYRGVLASQSIWDNIFIHHNIKAFPCLLPRYLSLCILQFFIIKFSGSIQIKRLKFPPSTLWQTRHIPWPIVNLMF